MPNYHLKVVKGRKETIYPCELPVITVVPTQGRYAENSELIDVPQGQRVKFDLEFLNSKNELERKIILIPRDGSVAYLMDTQGNTIDTYPKKRHREVGPNKDQDKREERKEDNEEKKEDISSNSKQEFGLKVGQNG